MSGNVSLTFRFADGTVSVLKTWTRHMAGAFWHPGFLDGDETVSRAYVAQWSAEFRKHFDPPVLAPCEYGLTVVDFRTRTFRSLDHDFRFGRNPYVHALKDDLTLACAERGQAFVECSRWNRDTGEEDERRRPLAVAEILENRAAPLKAVHGPDGWWANWVVLDLSPWRVVEYPATRGGSLRMLQDLLDDGFAIDAAAMSAWTEWTGESRE